MSAAKGQYISTTYTAPAENDIRTFRIDSEGKLMVAATATISGGATAALQTSGNASLTAIDADMELLKQPTRSATVTEGDATDITATATKGLWVGTGGDLAVRLAGDSVTTVLKNVPSGTYVPGAYSRVMAATTAADIVSFYGP
jgi:hypothetical protein